MSFYLKKPSILETKEWTENKNVNPKTKMPIYSHGPTYKLLESIQQENPLLTGNDEYLWDIDKLVPTLNRSLKKLIYSRNITIIN